MMASSEKFCLRWNDFESNISSAFSELREDKDFFDVTLVCDEDQIQAHKVILSACSPFFRSVLKRNRHEHPLLYMKGTKYVDIVSVLNFMYHGEVNVAQEELNSFLAVAEDLKVKGLTQNDSKKSSKSSNLPPSETHRFKAKEQIERQEFHSPSLPTEVKSSKILQSSIPQQPKYKPARFDTEVEEIEELIPIKSEPGITEASQKRQTIQNMEQDYIEDNLCTSGVVADPNMENSVYGDEYGGYDNYEVDQSYGGGSVPLQSMAANADGTKELDAMVEEMMSKTENPGQTEYVCNVCQKIMKKKQHMRKHVETHIQGVTHDCKLCGKTFKTRNSLETHTHAYHKGGQKVDAYSWDGMPNSTY